jgi:hypothetical protein
MLIFFPFNYTEFSETSGKELKDLTPKHNVEQEEFSGGRVDCP